MREAKFATKTTPTPLGAYLSKSRLFGHRVPAVNGVGEWRRKLRRSSAAAATSREAPPLLRLGQAARHRRWDRGLPGPPASRRLPAFDPRLDAAMIFPVNKIPIST